MSIGRNVLVHETAILADVENIEIGSNVRIDAYAVLSANGGSIRLEDYIHIGGHSDLFGGAGIVLESFSGTSQGVRIYSVSDDMSGRTLCGPAVPAQYVRQRSARVRIGRYAVACSGSMILPGANMGEGSILGAHGVARKNLEPWGIYAGNPLKRITSRRRDLLELEAQLLADHIDGKVIEQNVSRVHREATHQHEEMGRPRRRAPGL